MSVVSNQTLNTVVEGENRIETVTEQNNGDNGQTKTNEEEQSKRIRAMTEKRVEYQLQQCWKKYKSAKMSWEGEYSSLKTVIDTIENIPELLKIKNSENTTFYEMVRRCGNIAQLDANAVAELASVMEQANKAHSELAKAIDDRIAYLGSDSKSVQSRLTRSHSSRSGSSRLVSNASKNEMALLDKERITFR